MSNYPSQEVSELRKSGQIEAAYRRGLQFLAQHPDDPYLKSIFGWVLYDKVKQIVVTADASDADAGDHSRQIHGLFREYAKLGLDRPGLLFSLLVAAVLRLPGLPPFLPKFLFWAGIKSFRDEDFQTGKGSKQDVEYSSLIERIANHVAKLVVARQNDYDESIREFALELVNVALARGQARDPVWLRYRTGQLLCSLGRQDQARVHLQHVVKQKPGEFWTWYALARCEHTDSPSTALALCAKAYLVAGDKSFTVKILSDMVQLALELRRADLAKWALDTHISIRQSSQWRIPEPTAALTTADWYQTATALKNPEWTLQNFADSAQEILLKGSWCKANLLTAFIDRKDRKQLKVAFRSGADIVVGIAAANRYPALSGLEPGAPLHAAIDSGRQHNRIVALKRRADGTAYDCLTQVYGILDHQNPERHLASAFFSPTDFCLLYYDVFAEVRKWNPGSPIVVTFVRDRGRNHAYRVEREEFRETEWIKRITGILSVHEKGFGFVKNAFVPPGLVKSELQGNQVTVVALKKPKRKDTPGELGWQVVCLRRSQSDN